MATEIKRGRAAWLTCADRLLALFARLNLHNSGTHPASVSGELILTATTLRFEPDRALQSTFEYLRAYFPQLQQPGLFEELLAMLRWEAPLSTVREVRNVGLLGRRLAIAVGHEVEEFSLAEAKHWRRAIQQQAELAPDEALSLAAPDPRSPGGSSLSRG